MTISLIILGVVLAIVGFAGCIIPIIPGPFLSYLALIILSFARNWEPFSASFLIVMGALTIIITILDYVAPIIGASKSGASKRGIYLSVAGMLLGIFIFPPWGIFIGAFIGGVVGEIFSGRKGKEAFKVGWAIFLGNMVSIGIKIAFSIYVIFLFINELLF